MRRLLMHAAKLIVVMLLGGFLAAMLVRMAPGFGVDEQELDSRLSHESLQALRQADAHESAGKFYLHSTERMLHGDLGYSRTLEEPVLQLLRERMPETLQTVGLGLLVGWGLGLTFAMVPLLFRNASLGLLTGLPAAVLLCMPAAAMALLFVVAHAPGRLVVGLIVFPKVFRFARNLLQQSAARPFVLMAWAKGLGRRQILLRHLLPAVAPQLLALAGVSMSVAFAAAIPVEVVCDLPGIGQLAWKAAMGRDLPLLVDLTLIVTMVTLVANSAADLLGNGARA